MFRVTLEMDYIFYPFTNIKDVEEMFSPKYLNGAHAYRDASKFRCKRLVKVEALGDPKEVLTEEVDKSKAKGEQWTKKQVT